MRGELESLWQEQDAVAEWEAPDSQQEMRDAIKTETEPVLAGLETTGKWVTGPASTSRGTTEVTSTTQVGETSQVPVSVSYPVPTKSKLSPNSDDP
ncbi:hypothetical protein B0H65DRAFT_461360 [Neurospora tetraspora]|uniref:Uncharacterized protein n=1 Tax=Neurospora tetraspora TaxID=94610 RepID=A0AAE0MT26_9PEZI|nr:hypothetical protein B0H65DRAFT_461360 [Neurospora tetraspora]